jgi:nondiscriminating glutamyl-tRNA synthetase
LKQLLDEDKAYYCFCTEEELEAQKQEMSSRGEAPKYLGHCSNLSKETIEKNLAEGKSYVIRFRMSKNKVSFKDVIRGEIETDLDLIGDIVIAKNLNEPLYNFTVVIDDHLMEVSLVIRGEDHISNTPKQIALYQAFE